MLAPWLSGCRALGSCRHASLNAWIKDKHLSIFVKIIFKKNVAGTDCSSDIFSQ